MVRCALLLPWDHRRSVDMVSCCPHRSEGIIAPYVSPGAGQQRHLGRITGRCHSGLGLRQSAAPFFFSSVFFFPQTFHLSL